MIATHYFPLCWLSPSCPHIPSDRGRWSAWVVHSTVYVCRSKHLLMQNRGIIYAAFQPSRANGQPFILAFFNYLWNRFTEFCGKPTSLSVGSWVTCNCLVMQLQSCWNALGRHAAFNTSWVGTASSSAIKIPSLESALDQTDILQLILHKQKPGGGSIKTSIKVNAAGVPKPFLQDKPKCLQISGFVFVIVIPDGAGWLVEG